MARPSPISGNHLRDVTSVMAAIRTILSRQSPRAVPATQADGAGRPAGWLCMTAGPDASSSSRHTARREELSVGGALLKQQS